jgi:hypothetical protein
MSAWIVSKAHVDLLVEAATSSPSDALRYVHSDEIKHCERTRRDEIGQMLIMENVASVSYRYPNDDVDAGELPGPVNGYYLKPYAYEARGYSMTPAEILNAVACYEYQSCEHPGWEQSEAAALCKALFRRAAMKLASGPWGWEEDDLAEKPKTISLYELAGG